MRFDACLARAAQEGEAIGDRSILPRVHLERAELCALRGDADGRRRELEQAAELYRAMGAELQVARIRTRLDAS